jgi:hypothetical protein
LIWLGALGCGASESDAPPGDVPPECTAGEAQEHVRGCEAGIPAELCAAGFEADGAMGCRDVLPEETCPEGTLAVPGEEACRELVPCGTGTWGAVPTDADTQHVDGAYLAGDSDGSADKPWSTLGAALAAASAGDLIAIAAGSYAGDALVAGRPVVLWGRCPAMVEIVGAGAQVGAIAVGAGAAGTEIRGLAVRGSGTGIYVSGAAGVLVEDVWVHDTAGRGIAVQHDLGPSSMTVRNTLVERATDIGLHALGSEVAIEASVFRDTLENTNYSTGYGVVVQPSQADGSPGSASLQAVVLEQNRTAALLVVGSEASVEGSVIRATQPSDLSSRDGVGIIAMNEGASGSLLSVSGSALYQNHSRGIAVVASSATVRATHIHDTQPQEWDDNTGEAIAILDADGIAADVQVEQSTFDDNHQSGAFVRGSAATFTSVLVRDTEPRRSDGAFGRGIAVVGEPDSALWASATIDSCGVRGGHAFGIYVADGSVTVVSTLVEQVAAQQSDGANGDGLAVINLDLSPASPALATVSGSRFENNSDAGAAIFGAGLTLTGSTLECNPVDIVGYDTYLGQQSPVSFDDGGGNRCACAGSNRGCGVALK